MPEILNDLYNSALFAAVLSWMLAQVIKTVIYAIKFKTLNPERIFGAGGMPSSHSATVCALAISVSRVEGVASTEFALAMVLALVVMYDATGVRRAAGLHAKQINRLNKIVRELDEEYFEELDDKLDDIDGDNPEDTKELKEFLGHTPLEVLCGALLGIIVAMLIPVPLIAA